jgi:cytochrome c peroxidase
MSNEPTSAVMGKVMVSYLILIGLCISYSSPMADDSTVHPGKDQTALSRIENSAPGLPGVPFPDDNPPSALKIRLGRKLFFDRRLSHNNTISCAMCHVPEQGFTVNETATAVGMEGRSLRRNAPTVLNVAFVKPLFLDGRETTLETQVISPFLARDEMAIPSIGFLIEKIRQLDDYEKLFQHAFNLGVSIETVGAAIASYERTLISANSPFDRWHYGNEQGALTPKEKEGFYLFVDKAKCLNCHVINEDFALFTDNDFHDTGVGWKRSMANANASPGQTVRVELAPGVFTSISRGVVESVGIPEKGDLGRYEVTLDPSDRWKFKTPTLRNISLTAPYMHDGSLSTLRDVVEFYDQGGFPHENLDPLMKPLHLTDGETDSLVAFLESLTGDNIQELVEDARSVRIGNPEQPPAGKAR